MIIDSHEFGYVCDIEPSRDASGSIQKFMPQGQYKNRRNLSLNRHGSGPFCKFTIPNSFQACGVYILAIGDGVRYVGECANLSSRFNAGYGNISPRNCFQGGQETNCRLNNLLCKEVLNGFHISLWFFRTTDYKSVEAALRSGLKPAWNLV